MTSLYLCYQSVLEPLTQTQVVAYLEGLARAKYKIILLTFEAIPLRADQEADWRQRLQEKGITWYWRRYHKRPTVPATAWDVFVGILTGLWLIRKHGIRLVHARAHVPGLMGLALKKLTRIKLLFDIRGFMAEEYVDAGVWRPNGFLFRLTKRVEARLVRAADGFVVLTSKARILLEQWYKSSIYNKPLEIIPCCVDFRKVPALSNGSGQPNSGRQHAIAYVGKLGGWYLTKEMTAFVAQAMQVLPGIQWRIWTQSEASGVRQAVEAARLANPPEISQLSPEALALELCRVQAGLSFVKPCVSKLASSATKVAEYLAAGLVVVATAGIGDTDEHLTSPNGELEPVGVLIRDFTPEAYRQAAMQLQSLLEDPQTPARCRKVAGRYYDLEQVGWARYARLYLQLLPCHLPDQARAPQP